MNWVNIGTRDKFKAIRDQAKMARGLKGGCICTKVQRPVGTIAREMVKIGALLMERDFQKDWGRKKMSGIGCVGGGKGDTKGRCYGLGSDDVGHLRSPGLRRY
ncbi:hypothetical protein H5410_040377 [Solanum commersonii]|uniref:Uncharacterized protein n=1 Tax=Solanum commersonii TaxID=4109 RepID=A0A9J5XQR6_SOLCO|nr:hypothetical protein H5410_040377 [Solanum commersonii]